MTNEEILKKAIEKAEKNGLDLHLLGYDIAYLCRSALLNNLLEYKYEIIFSHEFAKAFFTNNIISLCRNCKKELYDRDNHRCPKCNKEFIVENDVEFIISWQYHLQQMVISDNPLEYLEKFV